MSSTFSGLITCCSFFWNNTLMSFKFFSPSDFNSNGFKCFRFSVIFVEERVVTRKRIQVGSLQKWFEIASKSWFRPWYSLSSKPSITMSMFLPGSPTALRGSLKSSANNSSTPMLLRSVPRFLDSCFTRACLYSGRARDKWQASDWIINWGLQYRTLLYWQKWLPDNLPASCILLQITAAMTDFPVPTFPLITITRFWVLLSCSQFWTLSKTHSRVPSWNLCT